LRLQNFKGKSGKISKVFTTIMMHEREPQKEPFQKNCRYCEPGNPATWEIVSAKGEEFVCDKHHSLLQKMNAIRKERLLQETEWTANNHYDEEVKDHKFEDTDQWEDGSMFGF
jgi:hypothetical protein